MGYSKVNPVTQKHLISLVMKWNLYIEVELSFNVLFKPFWPIASSQYIYGYVSCRLMGMGLIWAASKPTTQCFVSLFQNQRWNTLLFHKIDWERYCNYKIQWSKFLSEYLVKCQLNLIERDYNCVVLELELLWNFYHSIFRCQSMSKKLFISLKMRWRVGKLSRSYRKVPIGGKFRTTFGIFPE